MTNEDCKEYGICLNLILMGVETLRLAFVLQLFWWQTMLIAYIHTLNFTLLYRLNNKMLYLWLRLDITNMRKTLRNQSINQSINWALKFKNAWQQTWIASKKKHMMHHVLVVNDRGRCYDVIISISRKVKGHAKIIRLQGRNRCLWKSDRDIFHICKTTHVF